MIVQGPSKNIIAYFKGLEKQSICLRLHNRKYVMHLTDNREVHWEEHWEVHDSMFCKISPWHS